MMFWGEDRTVALPLTERPPSEGFEVRPSRIDSLLCVATAMLVLILAGLLILMVLL